MVEYNPEYVDETSHILRANNAAHSVVFPVFCKDCQWADEYDRFDADVPGNPVHRLFRCDQTGWRVYEDDYCSWGIRKDV